MAVQIKCHKFSNFYEISSGKEACMRMDVCEVKCVFRLCNTVRNVCALNSYFFMASTGEVLRKHGNKWRKKLKMPLTTGQNIFGSLPLFRGGDDGGGIRESYYSQFMIIFNYIAHGSYLLFN